MDYEQAVGKGVLMIEDEVCEESRPVSGDEMQSTGAVNAH